MFTEIKVSWERFRVRARSWEEKRARPFTQTLLACVCTLSIEKQSIGFLLRRAKSDVLLISNDFSAPTEKKIQWRRLVMMVRGKEIQERH